MKLSNQALGAIMLALQNSLMHQTDIVPVLRDFDLILGDNEEVIVVNPPVIKPLEATGETDDIDPETMNTVGSD